MSQNQHQHQHQSAKSTKPEGQGVLADHDVLMVMDEDGVLHGVAEEKDNLVKVGTWILGEAKGVPATKSHCGEVGAPESWIHQRSRLLGVGPKISILYRFLKIEGILLDALNKGAWRVAAALVPQNILGCGHLEGSAFPSYLLVSRKNGDRWRGNAGHLPLRVEHHHLQYQHICIMASASI